MAYIFGPNICGDSIAFRNDGKTMVTGSYRWKDVIEVWDLRRMARTRVIDWDGTGDQILVPNESDAELTMPEETSAQEEETKSMSVQSSGNSYTTSQIQWTETAATRKKAKEPAVAPYLYTTKFNAQ